MTKNRWVLPLGVLVVVLQAGILISFKYIRQSILDTGRHLVVQTAPVDPRDLFRGDYVQLNYPFSSLHGDPKDPQLAPLETRHTIYVKLTRLADPKASVENLARRFEPTRGPHRRVDARPTPAPREWTATAIRSTPFSGLNANEVMLRGYLEDRTSMDEQAEKVDLRITYGIENYYLPEGKGKFMEGSVRPAVTVELAVKPDGQAAIAKLLLDGKELSFR